MTTELEAILTGTRGYPRARAPEPLLLPRIASRIAVKRLGLVCETAEQLAEVSNLGVRWEVILDATVEAIEARRDVADAMVDDLAEWLHRRRRRGPGIETDHLRWLLDRLDGLEPDVRWALIGALLPQLDPPAVERLAVGAPDSGWLATLAASRAAGRLGAPQIVTFDRALRGLDYPWSGQARRLLAARPADTAFEEVTRALPYDRRLAELLVADPDEELLVATLRRMREEWGAGGPPRSSMREPPPSKAMDGPEPPPEPLPERFLQASVQVDLGGPPTETRRSFVAGKTHRVRFWIGPDAGGIRDERAFDEPEPDEEEKRAGAVEIRVVMDYAGARQEDTVALPIDRTLASRATDEFLVAVGEDRESVATDVWLLHKGRVIHYLELGGPVSAVHQPGAPEDDRHAIRLQDRVALRDLPATPAGTEYRTAAVQRDGKLLVFGPFGVADYSLAGAREVVREINDKLYGTAEELVFLSPDHQGLDWVEKVEEVAVADEADEGGKQVLGLLRFMAAQGNLLYRELERQGLAELPDPIQFVNLDPTDAVPFEYVYDKGVPKKGARLCGGWREFLEQGGECACGNRPGQDAESICPSGFWSLSKRIERQERRLPRRDEPPVAAYGSSPDEAGPLPAPRRAAFAASSKVADLDVETMCEELDVRFPDRYTKAEGWQEWCLAVEANPDLLVLLPHHGKDEDVGLAYLEISAAADAEDRRYAGTLGREFVNPGDRQPGPLVLLLGCKTAEAGLLPFHSFAREFQAQRASIVVATHASVLGRHARPVAVAFLDELAAASAGGGSFSEVMRKVRRAMFAKGYLMALALVAYGDGDWKLAPAGGELEEHVPA